MIYLKCLPCASIVLGQEGVQTQNYFRRTSFGCRLRPHKHISLVSEAVVHAKVVRPQFPRVKHVLVRYVWCREVLLEVEGQHVYCILTPRLELTSDFPALSFPAPFRCPLVGLFTLIPPLCISLMFSSLTFEAALVFIWQRNKCKRNQFYTFFFLE